MNQSSNVNFLDGGRTEDGRTDGQIFQDFGELAPILGDLKRALPSKKLSFWGAFKNTKKLNKRRLRAHTPILGSLEKLRLRRNKRFTVQDAGRELAHTGYA